MKQLFSKQTIKSILQNIYFWIILFFLVRLIGITNPPLETAHNWRQTTVTMVARNFYEIDNNIFYPRIDIAGEKTGITGMEFPVLNYLIYLLSQIFGYQHWYGRLINLIISSLGILFFYKLVKKYFTEKLAFASTLILLVSIWFAYSRKIMPDTFSVSFILMGIYFGTNYLDKSICPRRMLNLILYMFFIAIGTLSKLPAAYLLIVFSPLLIQKEIPFKRKLIFISVSIASIVPAIIWYFYWVHYLVDSFGFWHFFMGKSFSEGIHEIFGNIPLTLKRFYQDSLQYVGFAAFVYGLVWAFIRKEKKLLYIFLLSFAAFLVIIFKAGFTFSHHTYYVIPFVPVMALIAGYGVCLFKNKITYIILFVICLEGVLNQQHDFRISKDALQMLNLENDLNKVSKRNDLILINSGNFPTTMYFAHRKGWIDSNENIANQDFVLSLKSKGLKYIVILKKYQGTNMNLHYSVALDNDDYCIYKL